MISTLIVLLVSQVYAYVQLIKIYALDMYNFSHINYIPTKLKNIYILVKIPQFQE